MGERAIFLGTTLVVVSLALNVVHTASHAGQHAMSLPGWHLAYIAVVIYAAPIVAAPLLWTRFRLTGTGLLAGSMAGSLVFGLLYHFVIPGPDNVFTQPPGPWSIAFWVTAVLLALLQAIGVCFGFWAAQRTSGSPATDAKEHPPNRLTGSQRGPWTRSR